LAQVEALVIAAGAPSIPTMGSTREMEEEPAEIQEAAEQENPAEQHEFEGNLEESLADGLNSGDLAEEDLQQLEAQLVADDELGEDGGAEEGDEGGEDCAPGAEDENSEDDYLQDVEVEEDLKDSVEGALRLKRLLSRDEDEPSSKRSRVDAELDAKQSKVKAILAKWQLSSDRVVKHVLESCNEQELDEVKSMNWMPDRNNAWKSPAELAAKYLQEMKERKLASGGAACDVVNAFKNRFKLDMLSMQALRGLCHKDLRYVFDNHDGSRPLKEVIEEAKQIEAEDDNTTASALPQEPGLNAVSRFTRLELIDPMADSAVFGDANLTFSLKLAKHRKALGHVGRVIATTFEEIDTLRERYKEIDDVIAELEEHFAEVYHGVDCTRIAIDPRFAGMAGSLGAVYYNFPHSGAIQGFFDGHPIVNWRHENLMRLFFRALRSFVKPGGYVKVSSNMGAVGVRYSYIVGSAIDNEFNHIETMPFLEWHLHRYGRSYGDKRDVYKRPDAVNNQSYNAQAADRDMVYCFQFHPSGQTLDKQEVKLPPTLKTLKACHDGPFKNLVGVAKERLANQLHNRFLTELSGTHVG